MRANEITIEQNLINVINSKNDFTHPLRTKRYIVGIKELHKSNNPSLKYTDIYKDVYAIVKEIRNTKNNTTLGGWYNESEGLYYVDKGQSIDNLKEAIKIAKKYSQIAIYDTKVNKVINIKY